jgi:hypothetical protein
VLPPPEKETQMNMRILTAALVMGTMAALVNPTPTAHAAAPGKALVCDNTKADPYTGTYKSVTVPAGASCYLKNAVVRGNLKALHGSVDVYVINTEVRRNIHIRGAERDVKIGPRHCRFDPIVGNNIKVSRSHNVAICVMSVKNNIMVTRNDGRMILRDNNVGKNIKVMNNLPYSRRPGDGQHRVIDAIRLRHNVAGRHIVVKRNSDRPLLMSDNSPTPTT